MTRFAPARRALSALLALLCPLTAGCAAPAVQETPRTPPAAATATPRATATPAPSPTPQDTGEAARLFAALDAEAFAAYAQRSGARVRALLADPAAQGLSDAAASWGDPSPEAAQAYAGACAELLERLFEIDRSALGEGEQLAYDVLQRYWEQTVAAASCAMFEEPFAPETGAQVWLPQALRLMRIETQDDAEAYVSLVEDAPRYLAALLELEQARAAEGLFLTEQALSSVLGQIDALLSEDGRAALLTAFSEALSRMEGLTDAQREAYEARAQALYDGAFADGWIALREGLAALSDQCRRKEGLYALGEQAQEYFALAMQRQAASALTPEDALLLLEQEYAYQYRAYYELNLSVDEAAAGAALTSGRAEDDLAYLLETARAHLDGLPETACAVREAPGLAAACVRPPLDAPEQGAVALDPEAERADLLLTLAREGYPGKQYLYARSAEDAPGLMQRALALPGYYDGWGAYAAELAVLWQDRFDQAAALMRLYDAMAPGVLMRAICSIKVNYEGLERGELQEYLSMYGLGEDAHVDFFFDAAVNEPFAAFPEALGYAQLADLMRSLSADLGAAYREDEALAQYLSYGPAYGDLLRERMDVWADAQVDKG